MNRSDIVAQLAESAPNMTQTLADDVLKALFEEIGDALARGERVELRNFGVFRTKELKATTGRNPRNGESVELGERRLPHFKAGKGLAARVRSGD